MLWAGIGNVSSYPRLLLPYSCTMNHIVDHGAEGGGEEETGAEEPMEDEGCDNGLPEPTVYIFFVSLQYIIRNWHDQFGNMDTISFRNLTALLLLQNC